MANIFKQKNIKCFKWVVRVPTAFGSSVISRDFTLQNTFCCLQLYSGNPRCNDACLYFVSFNNLSSPVMINVQVESDSNYLGRARSLIAAKYQRLWKSEGPALSEFLIFEIYIDENATKDDKSVQTPSYFDARFGVDQSSTDLLNLLENDTEHDVEFTCGNQIIKAHRNILSCRSSVIKSMLQSNMLEGNTGEVHITDMDATVFKLFLISLYTGVLPDISVDTAVALYKASDKYAVDSMKEQCAEFLADNLSLEHICEILVLADQHNDPHLLAKAKEYVFRNHVPILAENWTEFCKDYPVLAVDVLNSLCQRIYRR